MIKSSFPKTVSLWLFALVIILLILNVIIDKYVNKDNRPIHRNTLTGLEIDKVFHTALKNYGFADNWIKARKIKNVSGDSLYASYSVIVPRDVPLHLILLELKDLFWENEVDIYAEEINSEKRTIIKIMSDGKLKLASELKYDDSINRNYGTISFLISDLPFNDKQMLESFLNTPELFYVVLIPQTASKNYLTTLEKSNKKYALMLNDDINELNYKLSSGYSDDKIIKSLKEIVGTFYHAAFIILDVKSDLYKSDHIDLIKKELLKRKITIILSSSVLDFSDFGENVKTNFQELIGSLNKGDEKVLLLTTKQFIPIIELIPVYRKAGYKFIYPGDIILRK